MTTTFLAAAIAAYWLLPGHPLSPFSPGVPIGPAGAVVITLAVLAGVLGRSVRLPRTVLTILALLLGVAAASRVVGGVTATETGWGAKYYANDAWSGPPEWSSDFRFDDRTRIDRAVQFENDSFPAFYLNGYRFETGNRREVEWPMTVEWEGHAQFPQDTTLRVNAQYRGDASIAIDGRPVIDGRSESGQSASASAAVPAGPGRHVIRIRYRKPANVDGQIMATVATDAGPLAVTPSPSSSTSQIAFVMTTAADYLALGVLAVLGVFVAAARWTETSTRRSLLVVTTVVVVFGVQGYLAASRYASRFYSLTAGDDWWGFESRARDILQHGPLMTLGRPLGEGAAYFFHPFYSYYLAAVHALIGESLFGPVFTQFLILAGVAVLLWRLASDCFGERAGLLGLAALVVLFELDFARYYTVTLLSENLYILTVALTVTSLARWARSGSVTSLAAGGFWGGVSSITRPGMLIAFVPVLIVVAVIAIRRLDARALGARAAAICAAAWALPVSLTAARNWIVASRFVLVSDGLGGGVVLYNIPASVPSAPYLEGFSGGLLAAAALLARIFRDHPWAFLATQVRKFGFTLGMTQWHEGYRAHPELIAFTALYVAMLFASRSMRQPALWPAHVFVVAHVLSMGLTIPWNYGYRLILPPFVFTATLSVAAAASLLPWSAKSTSGLVPSST